MSQPSCLIQQTHCGRIDGNFVCPKCCIDEQIRYTTEEARQLAIAKATDTYWQAHATNQEEEKAPTQALKTREKSTPESPKREHVRHGLAVVVVLLGGGYGAWWYDAYQNTARVAEFDKAHEERMAIAAAAKSPTSLPRTAPDPSIAPSSTDCTYCLEMVVVPGGSFQMGSNDSGFYAADEHPVHSVLVKRFAIGKYEVTQGQWRAVMGSNPSHLANCGDNCPVDHVSWDDIQSYIQKLNQETGQQYRLPSEAEWEYACRGGQQQKYCGSDTVSSVAWYSGNSPNTTHPVGQKAPNGYSIYDMSGNVNEWVQDWYHDSYNAAPNDGSAWVTGGEQKDRVLRGGSWLDLSRLTRSTFRYNNSPGNRRSSYGFRLAKTVP